MKQLILKETGSKQNFYHFVTKNKTFSNKPPNLTGRYILNMSTAQTSAGNIFLHLNKQVKFSNFFSTTWLLIVKSFHATSNFFFLGQKNAHRRNLLTCIMCNIFSIDWHFYDITLFILFMCYNVFSQGNTVWTAYMIWYRIAAAGPFTQPRMYLKKAFITFIAIVHKRKIETTNDQVK